MKQYLTRREVTDACNVVYDTVRRWEKAGLLPNTRTRADGVIEIAVADMVAADKLDPLGDAPPANSSDAAGPNATCSSPNTPSTQVA